MNISEIYKINSLDVGRDKNNYSFSSDFDDIVLSSEPKADLMYYLRLQMEVLKITCQYQALSNIIKAKADSALNAIRNIR